jgi:hypothetical protein
MSLEQWFNMIALTRATMEQAGELGETFDFDFFWEAFCVPSMDSEPITPSEVSELCRHEVQKNNYTIADMCASAVEATQKEGVAQ